MVSRVGMILWNCHMLEWFQMSCDSIFGSPVIWNHSLSIHFGWHFDFSSSCFDESVGAWLCAWEWEVPSCADPATSFQGVVCNAGWHWDCEMLAEGLFNCIGASAHIGCGQKAFCPHPMCLWHYSDVLKQMAFLQRLDRMWRITLSASVVGFTSMASYAPPGGSPGGCL